MAKVDIWHICATEEDAETYKDQVEREYPPQGYGTHLQVHQLEDDEGCYYIVGGYRYDSCD